MNCLIKNTFDMNVFNLKMFQLFSDSLKKEKKLDFSLNELLSDGFINRNECFLLTKLYKNQAHISANDLIDKIGYECFVNSLHIDDYVDNDHFIQTILFSEAILKLWNESNNKEVLEVIVSETDFGFNIKFHVKRNNEVWIDLNDLNNIEEAIMVLNS